MKHNAIVFDLDDTLIDTRKRHYRVVIDFLKLYNIKVNFSFEEYINVRTENKFSNFSFLKYYYSAKINLSEFEIFWQENIEHPTYLSLDEEIINNKLLEKASPENDLYILSLRSNHTNAISQVNSFSFRSLFRKTIFLEHQQNNNPKTSELLKVKKQYQNVSFIGDSESDKVAATQASVNFILVETGIYKIDNAVRFSNVNTYLKQL